MLDTLWRKIAKRCIGDREQPLQHDQQDADECNAGYKADECAACRIECAERCTPHNEFEAAAENPDEPSEQHAEQQVIFPMPAMQYLQSVEDYILARNW